MHLNILFTSLWENQSQLHRESSLKSLVPASRFLCSCFLCQELCTEALLRGAMAHTVPQLPDRGAVCAWCPRGGQHTVPQVWRGLCFARSMGSCWMRDRPTPTSTCTSGQQRRRTTPAWWSRWRCVKLKVRGEKGVGKEAWDEEKIM